MHLRWELDLLSWGWTAVSAVMTVSSSISTKVLSGLEDHVQASGQHKGSCRVLVEMVVGFSG